MLSTILVCFIVIRISDTASSFLLAGSDGELDVERKSRRLDRKRAEQEKDAEAELQLNIQGRQDDFQLPTPEVGCRDLFSHRLHVFSLYSTSLCINT